MLKAKRTEKEILDDFKKIDGSESRSNFTNKQDMCPSGRMDRK